MQSPAQRGARLVSALEDLAAQEEASLRAGDFFAVTSIQERAGAVIDALLELVGRLSPATRDRVVAVEVQRTRTSEWLAREIESLREALRETDVTRRRVAQIAPVYGAPPGAARLPVRLNAMG